MMLYELDKIEAQTLLRGVTTMNTTTTPDYEQQSLENKQGIANLVNTARLIVREFNQTDAHTSDRETEPEWWLAYSDLARQASIILARYNSQPGGEGQ